MVSKEIRQRIVEIKEIIDLWVKFNNLIKEAQEAKLATEAQEQEFLAIKTALARKQQALSNISPLRLMNILSQATTLSDMIKTADIQARKFYTDWHEAYLNLNELLGRLESGKIGIEILKPVLRKEKKGRGCLYDFVLLVIFIILAVYAFRFYDKKYDLKPKIKVWLDKYIFKNEEEKINDQKRSSGKNS